MKPNDSGTAGTDPVSSSNNSNANNSGTSGLANGKGYSTSSLLLNYLVVGESTTGKKSGPADLSLQQTGSRTTPRDEDDQQALDGDDSNQQNPGKMFIGGLSWNTTAEGLRDYFTKFGEVNECMVMVRM